MTLLTISTLAMWGASGFLARAFAPFEELGFSVDLVATSQSAVSVTLDQLPDDADDERFSRLIERLEQLGRVRVIRPCAVVSIVGRRIRTVLHELGPALSVFREHDVHLVSESSEDLNLSFVVEEQDALPLVQNLHARLFPAQADDDGGARFGPTWEALQSGIERAAAGPGDGGAWWRAERTRLLRCADPRHPRYVYHLPTVRQRADALKSRLTAVDRFHYSMKANPHPQVVGELVERGFGLECVSLEEVKHARERAGAQVPLLFTPNFCPIDEYAEALELGAEITIDGPHVLEQAPELFRGCELGVRVDPGAGLGHHEKVRTAGAQAKFGHPLDRLEEVIESCARRGVSIVGLHAHVGSGIRDAELWARTATSLLAWRERLADLRWLDLGGGLAVVERPGQRPLDLDAVQRALERLTPLRAGLELWLEPGRYLSSEAGVLLTPVTQVRRKGDVRYVGTAAGMHTLLRPALYGAWHAIHNLTRLDERPRETWHVVGPICESGDVLGRDRLLPPTQPGDILLIENCGAYGAVMASRYNLREAAAELVFDEAGVSGDRTG